MDGYPYAARHNECGQVAFYLRFRPRATEELLAKHVVLPDGKQPVSGERMVCGACGQDIGAPPSEYMTIEEVA